MRFISGYLVVCTDMDAFRAAVPDITDVNSALRGLLEGRSGAFTKYSLDGSKSMKLMSSIEGVEHMEALPFIEVICFEDVFGYEQQREVDGVLQWTQDGEGYDVPVMEDVAAVVSADTLYKTIWDYTETLTDSEGNEHTRPKFFVTFGPKTVGHIQ